MVPGLANCRLARSMECRQWKKLPSELSSQTQPRQRHGVSVPNRKVVDGPGHDPPCTLRRSLCQAQPKVPPPLMPFAGLGTISRPLEGGKLGNVDVFQTAE